MQPLVSIIVPVYNSEDWLARTLECAIDQTWSNKEITIVDDGSTDNSLKVARRYEGPNVKVISQENQGACAARNRALAHAQGEYIQYLDADDLLPAEKIEVQMRALRSGPPDSVASTRWCRFYERIGDGPHPPVPEYWEKDDPLEWLIEAQSGRAMQPPLGWLAPRSVIEEAGPWNENLLINQDGEYFARVLLKSNQIVFSPETVVYYRSGIPTSVSSRHSANVLESQYEAARCIEKHMRSVEDSMRVRRACAHTFQRIAYAAYPEAMRIVEKAETNAERLGGSDEEPRGSEFFHWVGSWLGWKSALWLRHHYWNLRYK